MSLSPKARSRHVRSKSGQLTDAELCVTETTIETVSVVDSAVEALVTEFDEATEMLQAEVGAVCCAKDYNLHHFMHLPDYLKHNPHITHGYRVGLSLRQTTNSFFHWHNESLNVWTHFAGLIAFSIMACVA